MKPNIEDVAPKWTYMSCPQCQEPIGEDKQIRCSNCKILFDWD